MLGKIFPNDFTLAIAELDNVDESIVVSPPKVIVRVTPAFAAGQRKNQAFSLSFSLNKLGIPQQIRLARGQASGNQFLAAQSALAQWRFEPKASAKFTGGRLEQRFSFQELSSGRCKPSVGTRLCR